MAAHRVYARRRPNFDIVQLPGKGITARKSSVDFFFFATVVLVWGQKHRRSYELPCVTSSVARRASQLNMCNADLSSNRPKTSVGGGRPQQTDVVPYSGYIDGFY